jgi:NAD(P)-dependent dehydrogenase (short-subunit alcohol dehydrogenase family)
MSKQTILVTGASSGFGLRAAKAVAQAGYTVYASMREIATRNAPQVAALADWSKTEGLDLRSVELDVQADSSVASGISHILDDAGRLDVIVHNAGHMVFGPAEAFTPDQFIQQYDVNVLGAQRVNRAALPYLRRQGRGLLLWVGSSSTRGGTPRWRGRSYRWSICLSANDRSGFTLIHHRTVPKSSMRWRTGCAERCIATSAWWIYCRHDPTADRYVGSGHTIHIGSCGHSCAAADQFGAAR